MARCFFLWQIQNSTCAIERGIELLFLTEIRYAISKHNDTPRANTYNRIGPGDFYKHNTNQSIAIHELGAGGDFKDFLSYLDAVCGKGLKHHISELQDLMRMGEIEREYGALEGRVSNVWRPNTSGPIFKLR